MTANSVHVFRQNDIKKHIGKIINRNDLSNDKEKYLQQCQCEHKMGKKLKTQKKKNQDGGMLLSDYKIEDIFLNSQYFKHQSKNQQSSISFCSGDHGENKWTIDSKFDMPTKQKTMMVVGKS
ncbi:hypothetical protein Phum_PHUM221250 [Pediculus humanus corporis]|uniref:Uncharacterized protein n=1 Tax=Pediculus humanus subsp. corporis TaxID=121224 RepID=E0VI65_PEDHC|nr:uncharacterized protein Phum_PHUM221250 [Pediculus humanus corporis]EEB13071.1 hypothetical protein Phum_PHUM221250 [Pediculus humanus corporis]